jgi:hypothetical protein
MDQQEDRSSTDIENLDRLWASLLTQSSLEHPCQSTRAKSNHLPGHLRFGDKGNAQPYQVFGWNHPEDGYTWTEGREVFLELPSASPTTDYFLNVRVAPLLAADIPAQVVEVRVGPSWIASWQIAGPGHYFALVPGRMLNARQELVFYCQTACSPRTLGIGEDDRDLALRFYELWLSPWSTVVF